ncbi:MAG: GNAT family N-acetyltransferase [Bryobacterales bacterium]|nr:GNAT family N-acetyltransferase [Bryobacterales bacterium]
MIEVRLTEERDFAGITSLCEAVYPHSASWQPRHLTSHRELFPEGQFVAVDHHSDRIVGMAASLIVWWDDYEHRDNWLEFTDRGMFTNHDPEQGRTLYGAEVMVHPHFQRMGIGKLLYHARSELVRRLGLLRIRAGARLRGYHKVADRLSAEEYVREVVAGKRKEPTLSFQLREGFHVFGVVPGYLHNDPDSMGWAALIEWINPDVASEEDYRLQREWLTRRRPPGQ